MLTLTLQKSGQFVSPALPTIQFFSLLPDISLLSRIRFLTGTAESLSQNLPFPSCRQGL